MKNDLLQVAPETDAPAPITSGLLFSRLAAVLTLRPVVFAQIADDPYALRQAAAVVCFSALAQPSELISMYGAWGMLFMIGFGLLRWCVFSGIVHLIGRFLAQDRLAYQRYLRALGFAEAPGIFIFVAYSLEPPWSWLIGFSVWFWLFAAATLAAQAAARVPLARAFVIVLLAFVIYLTPPALMRILTAPAG